MGLLDWLFPGRGHGVVELARRLGVDKSQLRRIEPRYHEFTIPKRSGGKRRILAPDRELKALQQAILRRLLARLRVHNAAMGFERGRSIVTNALAHRGQAVVLRFDVCDFFPSTSAKRLQRYFRRIGWNRPATKLLLRWCTHDGGLPQGAATSPRLSNLLNYRLDARLAGMAAKLGAVYTRYADDITVSFAEDDRDKVHYIQRFVRRVVEAEGYRLHHRKKLSIRRRHHQQIVTGLVVNDRVNLPRSVRRWLRAVEHRAGSHRPVWTSSSDPPDYRTRKRPTLSAAQLEGWQALQAMVTRQAAQE
jgi:retron-type reverse transcriptase